MNKISKGIKDNDYFGAGITDNISLFGLPHFANTLIELGKPYICGINIEIDKNNLSLFAINEIGYKGLLRINDAIQKKELTFEVVSECAPGLVCVIETNHGEFKTRFLDKEDIDDSFAKYLYAIAKPFGDNFYLGN